MIFSTQRTRAIFVSPHIDAAGNHGKHSADEPAAFQTCVVEREQFWRFRALLSVARMTNRRATPLHPPDHICDSHAPITRACCEPAPKNRDAPSHAGGTFQRETDWNRLCSARFSRAREKRHEMGRHEMGYGFDAAVGLRLRGRGARRGRLRSGLSQHRAGCLRGQWLGGRRGRLERMPCGSPRAAAMQPALRLEQARQSLHSRQLRRTT